MLEQKVGRLQPYLLLAPALAILTAFLLFPLTWNVYLSLHDVSLTTILSDWKYVGLKNFVNLVQDSDFHMSLLVSLIFVGGSVALQFFVGMVLAVVLNQQIRGSNTLRAMFIIPWTVSAVDRKSTRLNSSHLVISYAVFCLKKKKKQVMKSHDHHVE